MSNRSPHVHGRRRAAGDSGRISRKGFVAFDANGVRWPRRGAANSLTPAACGNGRGGNWLGPLGTDIIEMPPGPAFAALIPVFPLWPELEMGRRDEKYRNVGGHFKGYVLDKDERPTFHYILNDVDIHEQPLPVLKTAAVLDRKFTSDKEAANGLYFLAAKARDRAEIAGRLVGG